MKVYDTNGKEWNKDPIDVRECCERLGWTTTPPKGAVVGSSDKQEDPADLKVADIRGRLDELHVPWKSSMKKAELLELLEQSTAK